MNEKYFGWLADYFKFPTPKTKLYHLCELEISIDKRGFLLTFVKKVHGFPVWLSDSDIKKNILCFKTKFLCFICGINYFLHRKSDQKSSFVFSSKEYTNQLFKSKFHCGTHFPLKCDREIFFIPSHQKIVFAGMWKDFPYS